jgi:hypothetical protein
MAKTVTPIKRRTASEAISGWILPQRATQQRLICTTCALLLQRQWPTTWKSNANADKY